jgi:multiple sugar transport system ATP-binding protein
VTELLGEEMRVMFTVAARRGGSQEMGREDDQPLVADLASGRDPREVTVFTASIAPDDRVAPHAPITLGVDVAALHFFDPTSGLAIGAESQQHSSPAALPDRTRDVHSFSPGGGG